METHWYALTKTSQDKIISHSWKWIFVFLIVLNSSCIFFSLNTSPLSGKKRIWTVKITADFLLYFFECQFEKSMYTVSHNMISIYLHTSPTCLTRRLHYAFWKMSIILCEKYERKKKKTNDPKWTFHSPFVMYPEIRHTASLTHS